MWRENDNTPAHPPAFEFASFFFRVAHLMRGISLDSGCCRAVAFRKAAFMWREKDNAPAPAFVSTPLFGGAAGFNEIYRRVPPDIQYNPAVNGRSCSASIFLEKRLRH